MRFVASPDAWASASCVSPSSSRRSRSAWPSGGHGSLEGTRARFRLGARASRNYMSIWRQSAGSVRRGPRATTVAAFPLRRLRSPDGRPPPLRVGARRGHRALPHDHPAARTAGARAMAPPCARDPGPSASCPCSADSRTAVDRGGDRQAPAHARSLSKRPMRYCATATSWSATRTAIRLGSDVCLSGEQTAVGW